MRVCVITGASSGIGRATALRFAKANYFVVLIARRTQLLEELLSEIDGNGRVLTCDVSDRDQIATAAASIVATEGRCDVLVNNAGLAARCEFAEPNALEVLDRVMRTNFFAAAWLTHDLLDTLRSTKNACVINVSSVAGSLTTPRSPLYVASKFALTGLSESLQQQLRPLGVAVKNVQPGPVITQQWPHADLRSRLITRWLAVDADRIAQSIFKAARPKACSNRVVPRYWRLIIILRALLPSLYRVAVQRRAHERAKAD